MAAYAAPREPVAILHWLAERGPGRARPGAAALRPPPGNRGTGLAEPLKFALSIIAFAWTLGWLLADLPAAAPPNVRAHYERLNAAQPLEVLQTAGRFLVKLPLL